MDTMKNKHNVSIERLNNSEDEFGIKILDNEYLNLVFKYDKLNVEDDVLTFEIKVLENPNNLSDDVLKSDKFTSYCSDLLLDILHRAAELYKLDDNRESNTEEPS